MSDLNSQLYDPASESSIHLPAHSQRTDWHGYWRWNRPTLMASCTAAQDDTVAAHSPAGLVKHEVCRSSACRAAEGWRFGWHWWCVCVLEMRPGPLSYLLSLNSLTSTKKNSMFQAWWIQLSCHLKVLCFFISLVFNSLMEIHHVTWLCWKSASENDVLFLRRVQFWQLHSDFLFDIT